MTDLVSLVSYRGSVGSAMQQAFAAWSTMSPAEWAEEKFRLKGGGRFRWDYAPYAREMFDSIFDRRHIETVLQLFSRGLKSTVVLLAIGYIIDQAPRSILSMWPTNSQAEKWSKDILVGELFDQVDCLRYLGSSAKKRTGQITMLHKAFMGGLIDIFGANAPGDLRRAKGSFLYADEIDAMENSATDEGDILAIFNKRADEFADAIRVFASYPSIRGASRINSRLLESDYRQWRSTCVLCGGEPFTMTRQMVRHDDGKPESAVLICPRCEGVLDDDQRYAMAHRQGDHNWAPTLPYKGKRGYQANAMLWPHPVDREKYPAGFLQMLAQQEIDAKNAEDPRRALRVLVNTVDAEPFDPTEETERPPDWKIIYERRENYTRAPLAARVVTVFVDVQINRLELEWRAWAPGEESWGLGHVVIDGDVQKTDIWQKKLTPELERTWLREDGARMALNMAFIDGGKWPDSVLHYLSWLGKEHVSVYGRVKATKGFGPGPVIDPQYRTITKNLKGHHIGTWAAKDLVNNRLRMAAAASGYLHFNQGYDEQFFQQLCTGIPTIVYEKGEEIRKFLNKGKFKDEGLDICVGALAAFRRRRWNYDALETELRTTIPQAPTAPPVPQIAPVRRRAGVTW